MSPNDKDQASQQLNYTKFDIDNSIKAKTAIVPVEKNVNLMVNGEDWLTFMCTPVQLESLGAGFLYNEKVIQHVDEIASSRICEQSTIDIWLTHSAKKPEKWARTSGCSGGKSAIDVGQEIVPIISPAMLTPDDIREGVKQLLAAQELYRHSRGIHCSALSDGKSIRFVSEDIGRHNTFDKLAGQHLLSGEIIPTPVVLTTGRVSSEMMQKASRLRAPFVISLTSPTHKSVIIAEQSGITLVGYARKNSFNVYTHGERISLSPVQPDDNATPPVSSQGPQRL